MIITGLKIYQKNLNNYGLCNHMELVSMPQPWPPASSLSPRCPRTRSRCRCRRRRGEAVQVDSPIRLTLG